VALITFDRFDGGLLLARPSSSAPANSLSELFNMDVQPGGWLRCRPSWRRTSNAAQIPRTGVHGLYSNGGYLWAFGGTLPPIAGFVSQGANLGGYLDVDPEVRMYIGAHSSVFGEVTDADVILGVTPWGNGLLVSWWTELWGEQRILYTVNSAATLVKTVITDSNCPRSGMMVTANNRIYAVSNDGQSVRFCKSQHFGAGRRAYGLGMYQGQLAVFTDQSIQLWNIDPDPSAMALDRVIGGAGTRHHNSLVSLNGDLLFLSESGVRSLTTQGNALLPLDVDVGLPVRPVTPSPELPVIGGSVPYQNTLALAASPFAQFWIAAPGYWSINSSTPGPEGWVAWSYSRQAKLNAWAAHGAGTGNRARLRGWTVFSNAVYMRHAHDDYLYVMRPDVYDAEQAMAQRAPYTAQTQWLDFGKPGKRKSVYGLDFDGKNVDNISILTAINGSREGVLAETINVGANQFGWTYSGEMLPVAVDGTEFKLGFAGSAAAEIQINRVTLHFDEIEG
jgi:hypothetical protein